MKAPKSAKNTLHETIKRCNNQVDYQGWRYSMNVGVDEFEPFDLSESETVDGFWFACKFLKKNFVRAGKKETVSSYDLKHAFEVWWKSEYPDESPLYISNGLMLLAIVHSKFAPNDLWYGMELSQYAQISMERWHTFCERYDYRPRNDLEEDD